MEIAGASILIVEDEAMIAMMMADMLSDAGYRISEADSPAAAFALIEQQGLPDLVISDQSMPGMTGAEMAGELIERHGPLPVLITSGYAMSGDFPYPALQKPFGEADLLAEVRKLLGE